MNTLVNYTLSLSLIIGFTSLEAQTKKEVYNAQSGWTTDTSIVDKKNSKNTLTKTRKVGAFDRISIEGPFQVKLLSGKEDSIKIQAPASMMKFIKSEVEKGKLTIRLQPKSWMNRGGISYYNSAMQIAIPLQDIDGLQLSGSGRIETQNLTLASPKMNLQVSGSGRIIIRLESRDLSIKNSGSGRIGVKGSTNTLQAKLSGSGRADLEELVSQSTRIILSGSGRIKTNTQKKLVSRVSGSGRVQYKNYPNLIIDSEVSGSGKTSSY